MGAADVLQVLRARGLTLTAEGENVRVGPKTALTDELRDLIKKHKADLLVELGQASRTALFDFGGPTDPASGAEALAERTAIMMEANGWERTTAFQEATWAADRERCWRRFLAHAEAIRAAPMASREVLLADYRTAAAAAFDGTTASYMAATMKDWLALPVGAPCH